MRRPRPGSSCANLTIRSESYIRGRSTSSRAGFPTHKPGLWSALFSAANSGSRPWAPTILWPSEARSVFKTSPNTASCDAKIVGSRGQKLPSRWGLTSSPLEGIDCVRSVAGTRIATAGRPELRSLIVTAQARQRHQRLGGSPLNCYSYSPSIDAYSPGVRRRRKLARHRFLVFAMLFSVVFLSGISQAGTANASTYSHFVSGSTVTSGSCKVWMNERNSDRYVQGVLQSWGDFCGMKLQRRKIGASWTTVSSTYWVRNDKRSTGFHWNGNNAGSRVCLFTSSWHCSPTHW
jgi:hypothetical protein